jgi:hypothetical protein
MNSLSGFNSQEIRRLHPYLSALLRRIEALEQGTGIGGTKIIWGGGGGSEGRGGTNLQWGTDDDILPTGDRNSGGNLGKVARADHQHLFKFPTTVPASTPDGSAYFDPLVSAIRVYVNNTPTTRIVAGATTADVQPTGSTSTGIAPRYSFADHSHPTALLPQGDPQTPVMGEIRYNANNKLVRWSGSAWVEVSVETVEAGTDNDVQPTRLQSAGQSPRFARADHSHPTAILPQSDNQTPVANEIRFDTDNKVVRWNGTTWVPLSVETFTIDWGTTDDVQATGARNTGTVARVARADHSHPTALLPQSNSQTPVENEIRFSADSKVVRWSGTDWVPLSVETFTIDWATNNDVQPTKLQSTGVSTRVARADHSHPTAILHEENPQPPVADEIRYNEANNLIRWNGDEWVEMSVKYFEAGETSDVEPTRLRSAGTSARYARANHSHPTALLPQSNSQTPVVDEIRYTPTNKLVRWIGNTWVDFISALPVPADPLILPFDTQVSSPQNRQLVNRSNWDNIGNATVFYRDSNNNQYRLIFARPLITCTTSTPSGKDVWTNTADELVLKEGTGFYSGSVLWRRRGNTQDWSPVSVQLSDGGTSFPTDVGVLIRSALTGTSGSRRWFLRGAQEGGSFRAPFAGIATFSSSNTPAPTDLATNLNDGYAFFIHDLDRVDIVKPTTNGNKYPTMLSHSIIAPLCRVFSTETDPSGHYVKDIVWNSIWGIGFFTTTSANTNLIATLPTIAIPYGLGAGRVLLYLHNPQSSAITTVFALLVRTPTSTGIQDALSSFVSVDIPANTTVVADMGHIVFPPSTTLSHYRSYPISLIIIRRRIDEAPNNNTVYCLGAIIVPQRSA